MHVVIDSNVRSLIRADATSCSVFAHLGDAPVHGPRFDELHDMYEQQRLLLANRERLGAWFPGRHGGSTYAAALFAAQMLVEEPHATLLYIADKSVDAFELALARLLPDGEYDQRILMCTGAQSALSLGHGERYTYAIVDYRELSDALVHESLCRELDERLVDEAIRFLGAPSAAVAEVVRRFMQSG